MKTLLIASLVSATIVLNAFAQNQPPPPPPPPAATQAPAVANPAQPGAVPPTMMSPAAPGQVPPTQPVAPGMSPAGAAPGTVASPAAPGVMPSPAASMPATLSPAASPSTAQSPEKAGWTNFILENFHKGGPIMWPILIVSVIGVAVVLERIFWWTGRWMRRDPKRIEKVFTAIETGDVAEASRLSRGSRDPVLRMMWNGLNHQHASLQGALQVAAGIEIKRAGRFLVVMDTLVTLAPLLGLLGTITGL